MRQELDPHLFRRESGRMIAALTRVFGVHRLALAEDVVQDAFCRGLEVWKTSGVPDDPRAWLLTAAKRRALDVLRRERTAKTFAAASEHEAGSASVDAAFDDEAIRDEQLRMMFSCCQPALGEEVQLALILNVLCGFGAAEIAGAFLSGRAAIEKRISRGKAALAASRRLFDLSADDLSARLPTVHAALYLLFNEGYHGASAEAAVRQELCEEALRLLVLLAEHPPAATPTTHALGALFCLQAARLPARLDAAGELAALAEQDRSRWDAQLITRGLRLLESSASGDELSAYHVEAAIAAVHVSAPSLAATDFAQIAALYERLSAIAPSPVVSLNRAIALGHAEGPRRGIAELVALAGETQLRNYPFYPAALGEFELASGQAERARQHFQAALRLARNDAERRFLERRLEHCDAVAVH